MAATIQTSNPILASQVATGNRGATHTIAGNVHTVSHASKLTLTMMHFQRARGCASYPDTANPQSFTLGLSWESGVRDLKTDGKITRHCDQFLVIETGAGADVAYLSTTQPTRAESQQRPAVDWRRRLLTYGIAT